MLSHIQPSALIGLVAGYAGHALALGGILAIFVVLVHAKPLLAQVIATLSVPLPRDCRFHALSELDCCRTFGMLTNIDPIASGIANTPFPFWRSVGAGDDPRNVTCAGERL
jgi:hypothetical protein